MSSGLGPERLVFDSPHSDQLYEDYIMKYKRVSPDKVRRIAELPDAVIKFYSKAYAQHRLYACGFDLEHEFGVFIEHQGYVYQTVIEHGTDVGGRVIGIRYEVSETERRLGIGPTGMTLDDFLARGSKIRKTTRYQIDTVSFKQVSTK